MEIIEKEALVIGTNRNHAPTPHETQTGEKRGTETMLGEEQEGHKKTKAEKRTGMTKSNRKRNTKTSSSSFHYNPRHTHLHSPLSNHALLMMNG